MAKRNWGDIFWIMLGGTAGTVSWLTGIIFLIAAGNFNATVALLIFAVALISFGVMVLTLSAAQTAQKKRFVEIDQKLNLTLQNIANLDARIRTLQKPDINVKTTPNVPGR